MKIDENLWKDKGSMESNSPYYRYFKAILAVMNVDPQRLLEILADFSANAEEQNAKTMLFHWVPVLNCLDDFLRSLISQYKAGEKAGGPELDRTKEKLGIILEFTHALLKKSRSRSVYGSGELLLDVLRLDDWLLVNKALRAVVALFDLSGTPYRNENKEQKVKDLEEWLLNMAFGYSLKNTRKLAFLDVLRDPDLIHGDLHFQYFSNAKESPTITTIRLSGLQKDPRTSEEIAKDLAEKNAVPAELFNSLWCKVRLAKTVADESVKELVVISSMVAYIAFVFGATDTGLTNAFLETEPKIKLVPSVVQLLKEKVSPKVHHTAFELLTALLSTEHNPSINIDLFPTVINQIAILSPSGLLQAILRDVTTVQLVPIIPEPISGSKYKILTAPEFIPPATAESSTFALSVLVFLSAFERSIIRNHSPFIGGLINSLCNFLLPPADGHYPYYVPIITRAMNLLNMLMRHNLEDYSATDAIISRLCQELQFLLHPDQPLNYAQRELDIMEPMKLPPRVEHRQELCKSLYKLLSSSIHLSVQRNPALQNALTGRAAEMQRTLDQQRSAAQSRQRQRLALTRPGAAPQAQSQARPRQSVGEEAAPEREEESKDESIVVSRRVLESKLIALCTEVFQATAKSPSKTCDPLFYSALTLIASVIRDIPTSVPDLISRGVIHSIIDCCGRMPIEENYLRDIMRGINAIVLHHDGCQLISERKIVYPILSSLLKEDYAMAISQAHTELYDEPARQLLTLYSQAEPLRAEIVNGIQNFFLGLYKKSEVLLQKLADAVRIEQKGGSGAEKEAVLEKCSQYTQALRGILYFTVALIQNEESPDHKKLLSAVNADCYLIRIILQLENLASVLSIYLKSIRKTQVYFALIIRRYVNDVFATKENLDVIMRIITERVLQIQSRLGAIQELPDLSDFISGKREIASSQKEDILSLFPPADRVVILLNNIESTCEIIKTLGIGHADHEEILKIVVDVHKLLKREIVRLSKLENPPENIIKTDFTEEEKKKLKDYQQNMELHAHYNLQTNTDYKAQLEQTYQQVRRILVLITKSAISKRRYEPESDRKFLAILGTIGKAMSRETGEIVEELAGLETYMDKTNQLGHLLYCIMTVDDIKLTLLHEMVSGQLIHDFSKHSGMAKLFALYQIVVTEAIKAQAEIKASGKPECSTKGSISEGLSVLVTSMMNIFERVLEPTNVKRQLQLAKLNTAELGFKSAEDFVASFVVYTWDTLILGTKYGEYGTCVRFLAECNRKGFELFLSMVKRSTDRKGLAMLLSTEGRRAARESPWLQELLPRVGLSRAGERPQHLPRPEAGAEGKSETGTAKPPAEGMETKTVEIDIRKIEAKEFVKEMERLFSIILGTLYEALYSVSSYKCKKLLFNLVENQENATMYKSEKLFVQLLNELQTVLFSLEFSFEATLIPSEETSPFPEISDIPLTPRLKNQIARLKSTEYTEEKMLATTKISILVDLILAFVRCSKKPTFMHILCENKAWRFLVVALEVICTKDRIWHNRDLLPKILMLVLQIVRESYSRVLQSDMESAVKSMGEEKKEEVSKKSEALKLPGIDDVKRLLNVLKTILEFDGKVEVPDDNIPAKDAKDKDSSNKQPQLVTSEIQALTLLLLYNLTRHYEFAVEVQSSGIIGKLCGLKTGAQREKLPMKLLSKVLANLFESPEVLFCYMKRIISYTLFAKLEVKSEKHKKNKPDLAEMQKRGAVSLEDFMENLQFLVNRDPKVFVQACKAVIELQKSVAKGGATKFTVVLTKETIKKVMQDKKQKVPEIPLNSAQLHFPAKTPKSELPEDKALKDYKSLLQNAMKDTGSLLAKANTGVVQNMIERLIDLHFLQIAHNENKETVEEPHFVVTEESLVEAVGDLIRVYPELISLLLTYKSAGHPKITGNTLVSFLLRSVFPLMYVKESKGELQVADNEPWRTRTIQFAKNVMYESKSLVTIRHRVLLAEMRRRIILELLTILAGHTTEKKQAENNNSGTKSLSVLYSCLSIFEGLLSYTDNTLVFPIHNVYQNIRLSLGAGSLSLIKLAMDILRSLNLNSIQAELLSAKLVKILERLTHFNTQKGRSEKKEGTDAMMISEDSGSMQNLDINPVVRELAEREEEIEGNGGSLSIYSDEYVEGDEESEGEDDVFGSEEEMEEGNASGSEQSYSDESGEEGAAEGMEPEVPVDIVSEGEMQGVEPAAAEEEEDAEIGEGQEEGEGIEEAEGGEESHSNGEGEGESVEYSEIEGEESAGINDIQQQAEDWGIGEDDDEESEEVIHLIPPEHAEMDQQELDNRTNELYLRFGGIPEQRALNMPNVGIDESPRHQRDRAAAGISDVYESLSDEAASNQVLPHIRAETLGEEEGGRGESPRRIYLHMQVIHDRNVPVLIERSEEEQKQREPSSISLYGQPKQKDSIAKLIQQQLTSGVLPVTETVAEEEKEEKKAPEETRKNEEEKKQAPHPPEAKREEPKPQLSPELIARRRAELATIIPNVQVEDSLLAQIDLDFLRALPESMRLQAVEPFIARNRPAVPRELLPESFLRSISDEALQNEILASAGPEFLAGLPPQMAQRADALRHAPNPLSAWLERRGSKEGSKAKSRKRELLEKYVSECNKGELHEKEINENVAALIKEFDDHAVENILRLLYLNIPTKIPINALISNVCYTKKLTAKVLDALLFILVNHSAYEAKMQQGLPKGSESVSKISLTDTVFPPPSLYNGMEMAHLTYYILPLRIFALLEHLILNPYVIRYLVPKDSSKQTATVSLGSIKKLRRQFGAAQIKDRTPLTEILSLVENTTCRTSVLHLDTFIQFIINLFKEYEVIARHKQKAANATVDKVEIAPPLITNTSIRQMCRIFYLEALTDKACNKLIDLLTKLSFEQKNAAVIIEETGQAIESICQELLKEWTKQSHELEALSLPKPSQEHGREEISHEYKLSRLISLLKGLYKGHQKKEEEGEAKAFKFAVEEEDSLGDFSPSILKKASTEPVEDEDKLSSEIRTRVMKLYERPVLAGTFDCLTELMSCITHAGNRLGAATKNQLLFKLVPAIEAFIIAYNHMFNDPIKSRLFMRELRDAKRIGDGFKFSNQLIHALYKFLRYNNKTINNLIRQLAVQSFLVIIKPFIIRFPYFLDFDNKRTYFRNELKKMHKHTTLKLTVGRNSIFMDSYNQLATRPADEMMGKLRVTLRGEAAVDAGGVTREWFTALSRAMFNPDIGLFKRSAHGNTYQPDPNSAIQENHINYFQFIGRIIGKALLDGMYLECFFTRAFYKIIVGQTLNIHDLEDYDMELYKSLEWLRDNDASVLLSTFSYTMDYFGETRTKELIENGQNIPVTNENKQDFIVRMCKAKLYEEIKPQMEALLKGLYELVPRKLICIFDSKEIELLISGLPDIDIMDLKKNTEYNGYTEHSDVIRWFWEVLESYTGRERAEFLQFVTGTSKVPLEGFKNLPGANGIQKFQIHRIQGGSERLPSAHTCFNQLDLPEYPSKEILQERLLKAIKEGAEFMGLL